MKTIGNFVSNFEFYINLFSDAERRFSKRYDEFSKMREDK